MEEGAAESCEATWRAELGGVEAREEAHWQELLLRLEEDRAALLQEISAYEVSYSNVIERARAADEREEQLEQSAYEACEDKDTSWQNCSYPLPSLPCLYTSPTCTCLGTLWACIDRDSAQSVVQRKIALIATAGKRTPPTEQHNQM